MPAREVVLDPFFALPGYEEIIRETSDRSGYTLIQSGDFRPTYDAQVNGERFIIRALRGLSAVPDYAKPYIEEDLHCRIKALQIGLGMHGLEQMVSYSLPDLTVVTRHAGTPLNKLSTYATKNISKGEWSTAFVDLGLAVESGLCLDTGGAGNATYSRRAGFTFIDYGRIEDKGLSKNRDVFKEFSDFLGITLCENDASELTPKGAAWRRAGRKAIQVMVDRSQELGDTVTVTSYIKEAQEELITP